MTGIEIPNLLDEKKEEKTPVVGYVHTLNFPEILRSLNLSIMVSTYQAQRILAFTPTGPEKLSMLMRVFERPTGMAISGTQMALGSKNKVWIFESANDVHGEDGIKVPYDIYFAPRVAYVTGDIAVHEMAFIKSQLHLLNTRFSCISTLSDKFSFIPGWKPSFVTEVVPEDRCHLSGFATDNTSIHYLTALGETNTKEGWRAKKADGGIVIDYKSGTSISRGLSMPHSPRLHNGKLFVLNSGIGEIQIVDPAQGNRTTVVRLPGFLRGLALYKNVAFVGLCKIREKKDFGNLPIESLFSELECAIHAIDLNTGTSIGLIRFTKGIEEIFDIQIIPGVLNPHVVGFEEETVNGLYILG